MQTWDICTQNNSNRLMYKLFWCCWQRMALWPTRHLPGLWLTLPAVHCSFKWALNLKPISQTCLLTYLQYGHIPSHTDQLSDSSFFLHSPCSSSPCLCPPLSSVTGGSSQLSVNGAGRQQLSLLQSLWQLPTLLLLTHRWGRRAQVWLLQEETVSY